MAIRQVIFDLGGVFIDIHYQRTKHAFEALGIDDFDRYFQQSFSNPLFADLETGRITPAAFYDGLRQMTGLTLSNSDIEKAWNAMLGDFRPEAVGVLPALKEKMPVYLLSNTNEIHWARFSNQYTQQFGHDFDSHFDAAYYSHQLGLRKPDLACFEAVIQRHQMQPDETLFVDDTPMNIAAAKRTGMHTLHLTSADHLYQVLPFAI